MFCSKCGKELQKDSRFCPECGTPIQKIIPNVQSKPVSCFTNQNHGFINQTQMKLSIFKIAILILSVLGLIFAFCIPYVIVYKAKSSYPLYLTGANDFPSFLKIDFEAAFTIILLLFVAEIITIVLSCLMEKKTLCLISSIAVSILSFVAFGLIMEMIQEASSSGNNIYCTPIGVFLQFGISIAIIVMVIKERNAKH